MAAVASSSTPVPAPPVPTPVEVLPWLCSLPSAPEFHPTTQEFQDPIAYILKIEKEAAPFGICKIVPPIPAANKKTALANLNRSFAARDPVSGAGKKQPPTFTTRQQQIGFCPRRPCPVQKHVWQSGEHYTLPQFESKARQFERSHLRRRTASRKAATLPALSPLEIETLFWRASADKPFTVEYANDMPGSGFTPLLTEGRSFRNCDAPANLGESAWNMRGVSRAKGSLLRLMKEEIPGVTSPMVYVAMLFSWFAWHVEDHELHSINYLHMGSGKTWYGVPRDARLAFEDVVRVHGYGGELNPLMTFAILGEKTTVMSPEVLVGARIPCCRLVQNAGEFVVTFPGAYHMGFSHGFNCGEAANIATPGWLKFAKEAAVRRASINYPPMVSHFQLLYALALSLHVRMPIGYRNEPRSSRLKHKMKGEGEEMVKNAFVQNVIHNNHLLSALLEKGTSYVVLPQNASESPICLKPLAKFQREGKPKLSLGLCSHHEALETSYVPTSNDVSPDKRSAVRDFNAFFSSKGNCAHNIDIEKEGSIYGHGLIDQGLLSCLTCGILCFACMAIIQPREATAKYLMSAVIDSGEDNDTDTEKSGKTSRNKHELYFATSDQRVEMISEVAYPRDSSALDLLASVYADLSDFEDEDVPHECSTCSDKSDTSNSTLLRNATQNMGTAIESQVLCSSRAIPGVTKLHLTGADIQSGVSGQSSQSVDSSDDLGGHNNSFPEEKIQLTSEFYSPKSGGLSILDNNGGIVTSCTNNKLMMEPGDSRCMKPDGDCLSIATAKLCYSSLKMGDCATVVTDLPVNHDLSINPAAHEKIPKSCQELRNIDTEMTCSPASLMRIPDRDSSRMHIFCLEHAVEVVNQLKQMGGVHLMLLCHPDYPKIELEAKSLAKELGIEYIWKNVQFTEPSKQDLERIKSALEDEEVIPMNSDWTVKLGINLYYSANLSKSPLYCKQMPHNPVIYKAFGRNSAGNSPAKSNASRRRTDRQKKLVVAGRWCGKVWMTNQVHPYLSHKEETEEHEQTRDHYSLNTDQNPLEEMHICGKVSSKANLSGRAAKVSGNKRKKTLGKAKYESPSYSTVERDSKTDDLTGPSVSPLRRTTRCSHLRHSDSLSRQKSSLKGEAGDHSLCVRKRPSKSEEHKNKLASKKQSKKRKGLWQKNKKRKGKNNPSANPAPKDQGEYICDIEGCSMIFSTKQELSIHKRDTCPVKGCGKKFFSHKYLLLHRKVHDDDRPLVCPWKGCKMTFKWPWARTEHIRVHTGDRPYVCQELGCGLTFRFVSDFSRHKRKTGHSVKRVRR